MDFTKRVERCFLNRNKGGVKNFGLDGEYGKKVHGSWFMVREAGGEMLAYAV